MNSIDTNFSLQKCNQYLLYSSGCGLTLLSDHVVNYHASQIWVCHLFLLLGLCLLFLKYPPLLQEEELG